MLPSPLLKKKLSSKQEQQLKTQNGSSITQLGALEDDEFEEFNAEDPDKKKKVGKQLNKVFFSSQSEINPEANGNESSKQEQQLKTQNGSSITQLGALEDDEFEEFNAEGS
ncbi:396_t:CDS:2 [Entrophospora sp. SA101]|nr:396_t:CDS:2 [Entrophospora sp. SA101]